MPITGKTGKIRLRDMAGWLLDEAAKEAAIESDLRPATPAEGKACVEEYEAEHGPIPPDLRELILNGGFSIPKTWHLLEAPPTAFDKETGEQIK